MMPEMEDLWTIYSSLCLRAKIYPLRSISKHLAGTEFSCPVEAVRPEHWVFLLAALSVDNTLTTVHFESCLTLNSNNIHNTKKKKRKSNKGFPTPYGRTEENITCICKSLSELLRTSKKLSVLKLENLPIRVQDAELLAKGLKNSVVRHISFAGCLFNNNAVKVLCCGLVPTSVEWIDFSSCHLKPAELQAINDLVTAHKTRRCNDLFGSTLRYQTVELDTFKGLSRISLNDNAVMDEGVAVLVKSLEDDHWIKAVDLYKCSIGNEGGQQLLSLCKMHAQIELLDLRFNNIDDQLLHRIGQQLHLNRVGKQIKYDLMPFWKPPKVFCRGPKFCTVKKIGYRPPPVMNIIKVVGNSEDFDENTEAVSKRVASSLDASTQTNPFDDSSSDELIIGEAKKMRKSLIGELKVRRYLTQEIDKYRNENKYLRAELNKLSQQDGSVVIDQETYLDIKRTFDKFKRFLDIMKDYGLWDFVKLLGVNENAEVVLMQREPESNMQMKVIEPKVDSSENTTGTYNCIKPGKLCRKNLEPEIDKCCQCQKHEKKVKCDLHLQCQNTGACSVASCTKPVHVEAKRIKTNINSSDKDSVLKIFKEVCKESVPRQSETKKKPEASHCKDCPKCHICIKQLPPASIPEKLRHFKCPAEFIKVVKSELEKCPHRPSSSTTFQSESSNVPLCDKSSNVTKKSLIAHAYAPNSSEESKKKANSYICKKVAPLRTSGEKIHSNAVDAKTAMSCQHSVTSKSTEFHNSEQATKKKKGSYEPVPANKNPNSVSPSSSTFVSSQVVKTKSGTDTTTAKEIEIRSKFDDIHQKFSNKAALLGKKILSEDSSIDIKGLTKKVSSLLSNSDSSLSDKSNSSCELIEQASSIVKSISSEQSSKVRNLKSKSKSVLKHSSSEVTSMAKSYLESVSDDSTGKDVKSFSEIDISSNASSGKESNIQASYVSHKQPSVKLSKAENHSSSSAKDKSKGSKIESSKHSRKSSKSELAVFSSKNIVVETDKVTNQKIGKNDLEDSVPSLSDITSVSARSLNTDSIMHQISEFKK